jgi:hypothetical protein
MSACAQGVPSAEGCTTGALAPGSLLATQLFRMWVQVSVSKALILQSLE